MNRQSSEDFEVSETPLNDTKMMNRYNKFVKTQRYTTPRVNSNINYMHRVIMIGQCRFTDDNKCTTLWRDVLMGGCASVWRGVYMETSAFSFNFAVNLKLLQKMKSTKKISCKGKYLTFPKIKIAEA